MSAVGELKCRNIYADDYPTIYLAKHKCDSLLAAGKKYDAAPLFFVMFRDKDIRFTRVDLLELGDPKPIVRPDCGEMYTTEFIYEVPIEQFRRLDEVQR
jgi:Holliday junction resolvase